MTIAQAIFRGDIDQVENLISQGSADVNDLDEYGFTALIETIFADNITIAKQLLTLGADINKPDLSGRTPLHWAVDFNNLNFCQLCLESGANPNAFTRGGQPILVYPLLRNQKSIKTLLYKQGGDSDFAQDFIQAKLIGHRYKLIGTVDVLNSQGEFIVIDYEGFILEFTVNIIYDSLIRFTHNFSTRALRPYFNVLNQIINAFSNASKLLRFQQNFNKLDRFQNQINSLFNQELLILPVAFEGHAISFIKYGSWFAKCDRGENSLREGSVNIYRVNRPSALTTEFLTDLVYKKQTKHYVHQGINTVLGLTPVIKLPISAQIAGNCSWANIEAAVAIAFFLVLLNKNELKVGQLNYKSLIQEVFTIYERWLEWDKDRALEHCIQSFYASAPARQASKAAILGGVLFQSCDYQNVKDLMRSEKILSILTISEYRYILQSYLQTYCVDRLTKRGNNLLHILDDCGVSFSPALYPLPDKR